ncbi:GntR family transcriptional regulator [Enterovirga sp. CN4-39]|uniref:GntR family transcriptional regulator n=1 Tax=Enterovirga sp. CN4-39 TaxID=3400910 RepID=UPI003C02C359
MAAAIQQAYEAIRGAIASGTYGPGQHLRAAEVADRLGISRTPVREALRRLSAEGLVEFFANRGAYVTHWSQSDVEEVFALRTVLEAHAAEVAAARLTPAALEELERYATEMEGVVGSGPDRDLAELARRNGEFHRIIITAAANQRLSAMISSVVEMALVTRTFHVYSDEDLARSMTHHRELIAAFRGRDSVWAGSVMRSHIRAAHHVFISSLRRSAPPNISTPTVANGPGRSTT